MAQRWIFRDKTAVGYIKIEDDYHYSLVMAKSLRAVDFTADGEAGILNPSYTKRDEWGFETKIPYEYITSIWSV